MTDLQKRVNDIVDSLFRDGMTPTKHFGIDSEKIKEVEKQYPEIAKQYPRMST